ncbi:MAG: nucleoside deaminase [Christensenellales bacterium]
MNKAIDEKFMAQAIALAKQAVINGDEPFGAVLVKDGQAVYSNLNQIYTKHDPTFHAEAGLIRRFCAETGITDLSDYTLYSNCEPCFMCCGALVWAKLGRLVYGASDVDLCQILGEKGSQCCQIVFESMNCSIQVESGVLREQALQDLRQYFAGHAKG